MSTKISELPNGQAVKASSGAITIDGVIGSVTPAAGTFTKTTVDNLVIDLNTISSTSGNLNLTPVAGSAIVLDGTISVDAGVVTGATSISSTAFTGDLTGNVTGNVSGSAATVTTAAQPAITSLGTLTVLQVDNIKTDGNTISATSGAINITPEAGSAIVLDGTISVDAGVVTGATSVSSTTFTGNLTGDVIGNVSGSAATVTTAAQPAITSVGTLTVLQVDNLKIDSNTISSTSGVIKIAPLAGQNIEVTEDIVGDVDLIINSFTTSNYGMSQEDGTGNFGLTFGVDENLTANRNLAIKVNDADRTLTIAGNATISGTNTGDQTNITGNAATATALATPRTIGGTSFDGTANIVPATITVADTTDSTSFFALFESATGDLAPKTDGAALYNASTGVATFNNTTLTAGTGSGTYRPSGALNTNTTAVGNITTGEDDLMSYTVPANTWSSTGDTVRIYGQGTGANNANAKTVKVYAGGTLILTLPFGPNLATGWDVNGYITKTGSSTQDYYIVGTRTGSTSLDISARAVGTLTMTDTNTNIIKFTGEATSTDDIIQEFMQIVFIPQI